MRSEAIKRNPRFEINLLPNRMIFKIPTQESFSCALLIFIFSMATISRFKPHYEKQGSRLFLNSSFSVGLQADLKADPFEGLFDGLEVSSCGSTGK